MAGKFKNLLIKIINISINLKNQSRFLFPFTHKRFIKKRFLKLHGYNVSFDNPTTLSEKIQWIKLYGFLEKHAKYADKYEVRNYVKKKIGKDYLIPLIGVYKSAYEINVDSLPEKFVIKATHGSGWNMIVKDKSSVDWFLAKKGFEKWINANYFYISGEKNYKNIKGRVIIEQLLEDPAQDMKEYKFYCYHGQPQFILVVSDPELRHHEFYDLNWNGLNMNINDQPITMNSVKKPYHYNEMLEICSRLSNEFTFVRVDLYYNQGKIYVGELTFTSDNGFAKFSDIEYDRLFGSHLNLSKLRVKT